MYKKVSNTTSMIVSPSTILLQPHVGGFHASDQEKISISSHLQGKLWYYFVANHYQQRQPWQRYYHRHQEECLWLIYSRSRRQFWLQRAYTAIDRLSYVVVSKMMAIEQSFSLRLRPQHIRGHLSLVLSTSSTQTPSSSNGVEE